METEKNITIIKSLLSKLIPHINHLSVSDIKYYCDFIIENKEFNPINNVINSPIFSLLAVTNFYTYDEYNERLLSGNTYRECILIMDLIDKMNEFNESKFFDESVYKFSSKPYTCINRDELGELLQLAKCHEICEFTGFRVDPLIFTIVHQMMLFTTASMYKNNNIIELVKLLYFKQIEIKLITRRRPEFTLYHDIELIKEDLDRCRELAEMNSWYGYQRVVVFINLPITMKASEFDRDKTNRILYIYNCLRDLNFSIEYICVKGRLEQFKSYYMQDTFLRDIVEREKMNLIFLDDDPSNIRSRLFKYSSDVEDYNKHCWELKKNNYNGLFN